MKFLDIPSFLQERLAVHKAEIAAFNNIKEADSVASALRGIIATNQEYNVLTFAAGMYYVVLIHPDFVGDTDVENTNP